MIRSSMSSLEGVEGVEGVDAWMRGGVEEWEVSARICVCGMSTAVCFVQCVLYSVLFCTMCFVQFTMYCVLLYQ